MQKARRHHKNVAPTACKRTVSGSISLPCPGCFSPFPHGTCSLSVSQEYLALADGAAGFRQDSSGPALLRVPLGLNRTSGTRLSRATAGLSRPFPCNVSVHVAALQPRGRRNGRGLGSSAFAHHYSRNHYCSLLLRVLRCFSSPRSPRICGAMTAHGGFPHSDIRGSQAICAFPRLFAACRVLLRLWEPQASPVRSSSLSRALSLLVCLPSYQYVYDLFRALAPMRPDVFLKTSGL